MRTFCISSGIFCKEISTFLSLRKMSAFLCCVWLNSCQQHNQVSIITLMAGITSYCRSELLSIGAALQKHHNRVNALVYWCLRKLDICSTSPTKRGSKGFGRLKIPVLINRTVSTQSRPLRSGSNINNLRLVKATAFTSVNKQHLSWMSRLSLLNARSACNKETVIRDTITEHNLDLLALTETWITTKNESRVTSGLLPEGYKIICRHRKQCRGGGVALVHRSTIKCVPATSQPDVKSFEVMKHY